MPFFPSALQAQIAYQSYDVYFCCFGKKQNKTKPGFLFRLITFFWNSWKLKQQFDLKQEAF